MPTIKEVKVKIESIIDNLDPAGLPEGDPEKALTEAEGFLRYDDGELALTYSEDGEGGHLESEIIYSQGKMHVNRKGAIESNLHFIEGEKTCSIYEVPPYKFDMELFAKRIRADVNEDGGKIDLFYTMKIGGAAKSARMKIWISTNSHQI